MKLYADRPLRLANQVLGDVLVLVLVVLSVRLGLRARDQVAGMATPGREAEDAARNLAGTMRGSARSVADAPVVGGTLSRPFRSLAGTSRDLAGTAQAYQDAVAEVATLTGVLVAGVPLLLLALWWLPRRVSWVVEASAAARLTRHGPGAADLLAVRALARQRLTTLARLDPWVVGGWKAGDSEATEQLARLELDALGLRPRGLR